MLPGTEAGDAKARGKRGVNVGDRMEKQKISCPPQGEGVFEFLTETG